MAKNYCSDCAYSGKAGGMRCCNYLLTTNQRRPCPPGEGCTVKVGRKVYRRKRKDG